MNPNAVYNWIVHQSFAFILIAATIIVLAMVWARFRKWRKGRLKD